MEEGRRSGDPSGYVVKNRNSSGCLIVRKKGSDGIGVVGSSGSHKVFESKKEKKRPRMNLSDSGSSDELLLPLQRRVGPETIRVCNSLSTFDKGIVEGSDIGRKRNRGDDIRGNEVGMIRSREDLSERKRNKLDVFDFDEYDGVDAEMMGRKHFDDGGMERRRFSGSISVRRSGSERDYETGSSRHSVFDRRKGSYFDRMSGLSHGERSERDGTQASLSYLRDRYDSDEPIRVQGKNGVLKVMVNKKKNLGGSFNGFDRLEAGENRKGTMTEDTIKRNVQVHPSFYPESKGIRKNSFIETQKTPSTSLKSLSTKNCKVSDQDSEESDTSSKLGLKNVEAQNSRKTPLSTKNKKDQDVDSEDSDISLKLGLKDVETRKSLKGTSRGAKTAQQEPPSTKIKEGKVKRGTGTEKQKLREQIRGMLLDAGWTIDYRPRRNRDYLDAVYINPTGTAYWSIIKAYDALLKQLNDDDDDGKSRVDGSPFTPLSDEVLSQLTRKTRKKMEKEMKKKQRDDSDSDSDSENARETLVRKSSTTRHNEDSMDSSSHEEKLSSYIKQSSKSSKNRMNGSSSVSLNSKGQSSTHHLPDASEKSFSGPRSHKGRKTKKLGRCTLLVRNTNEGLNSESNGFVPYSGKRTVLSWLIDCGTVELSQKVRYMNRRRTKVMLEGWVTRDGIHCGCCSKILTVSKFEIHAGSKLRQPFQNICLDSGVSLLDCQVDAWNKQDSIKQIGFHSVDVDGDDPNDDTCGLCGDGGNLICCDGCPSTFHLSCLDIKMLPPGDWHCPNCTCKFCGVAGEKIVMGDDATASMLLTCSLCTKKYHKSCMLEIDTLSTDACSSAPPFCGKKCSELFEHLQKYLGVKHELEAGFSWSLIHRTDADLDTAVQGFPQRVECNSKLAVALSVMDECFLPILDRRSGINLIQNVLYNCGSNFNRLNYSGFYTVILERGDEIISAASIRLHGTKMAEMPFIGTRHIYRRQGMCRRLFSAIELALCSLKVEKLIIPAISELMHTWTAIFGFSNLDESVKPELKSMNMLVFPGIDMLQKQLVEQGNIDSKIIGSGVNIKESEDTECVTPEMADTNIDSSAGHSPSQCGNCGLEHSSGANDQVAAANSGSQNPDDCLNDTSTMSSSIDASLELKSPVSVKGTSNTGSESGNKLDESDLDKKSVLMSDTSCDVHKMNDDKESDSPADNDIQADACGDMAATDSDSQCPRVPLIDASVASVSLDASHELKSPVSLKGTTHADCESEGKLAKSASGNKCEIVSDTSGIGPREEKAEQGSLVKDNSQSIEEAAVDDSHALNLNEASSDEIKTSIPAEEIKHVDSQSEEKSTDGKVSCNSEEIKHGVTSPVKDNSVPCYEVDMGEACTVNIDVVCPQVLPSTGTASSENPPKNLNEVPGVNGADETSMQTNHKPNDKNACGKGSKSDVASDTVSVAAECEESVSLGSGDSF